MPTYLIPHDTNYRPVLMDRAILFFGRHPDCDVIITCSRKVSRKHCCVAQIDDYFVVRDLGSMNGVLVNGKPAGREHVLRVGDTLHVGDVPFNVKTGHFELPKGRLVIGPSPEREERRRQIAAKQRQAQPANAQPSEPPNGHRTRPPSRPAKKRPRRSEPPAGVNGSRPDNEDARGDAVPSDDPFAEDDDVATGFGMNPRDKPSAHSMALMLGEDDLIDEDELPEVANPMTALPVEADDEVLPVDAFDVVDDFSDINLDFDDDDAPTPPPRRR